MPASKQREGSLFRMIKFPLKQAQPLVTSRTGPYRFPGTSSEVVCHCSLIISQSSQQPVQKVK